LTLASAGVELVHVNVRPPNVWPAAFRATAPNVTVVPSCTVANEGETTTLETTVSAPTGFTAIVAAPATPPALALMVVVPGAIAATRPVADTDATDGALLDHANVVGVIVCPAALKAVAIRFTESPWESMTALGEIVIRVI
jgi:hypothetical protein